MTEEQLREEFKTRSLSGQSPILAIYELHDELLAAELAKGDVILACERGCGFCCHQLINVTKLEWQEIVKFIDTLPFRQKYWIKRRSDVAFQEWKRYDRSLRSDQKTPTVANILRAYSDWMGKAPCPFLNGENSCDIYPVRPIMCRTYTSTHKCQSWDDDNDGRQFRFEFQSWVNNLIFEIQPTIVIAVPFLAKTLVI